MPPCYKHLKLDSNFPQARTERLGDQTDEAIDISAFRPSNGLKWVIRRIVSGITCWHQRRTMIRKLQALNDHYLRDIGLERADIVPYVDAIHRESSNSIEGQSE